MILYLNVVHTPVIIRITNRTNALPPIESPVATSVVVGPLV